AADARRRRGDHRAGRNATRQGVHLPSAWRAPPARTWARRSTGARGRSGADEAHRLRVGAVDQVRRVARRDRRARRAGTLLPDQIRLLVNPALRGSAAHVFVSSLVAPQLTDEDEHHLRRVLRIRDSDVVTLSDGIGSWTTARLPAGRF